MSDEQPQPRANDDAPAGKHGLSFPVVGIGASAGGLNALKRLLEKLPEDSGMAFVVILHLSPNHESLADSILQRSTAIPVTQVCSEVEIAPDHIYLIPPSKQLLMNDGKLCLSELERMPGTHMAIDLFFRSLGEAHRERAVAIVLSGTGSDGSQGLRRVKECGGVTLVQSPTDAEHDVMPLNAMATGLADFVLPADQMADKLVELWQNAQQIVLPEPPEDMHAGVAPEQDREAAQQAFREVMETLLDATGHDFRRYKRATVLRRLERRMQVCRQATLPAYLQYMNLHPEEARLLLQDMLISVTNFFRDREAFDALEGVVAETLREAKQPAHLRAWVAGCATGEEAYSLAVVLLEQALARSRQAVVQVFATDVDERSIAVARSGVYADAIAADVPPQRLQQFFTREGSRYRISKTVRERVTFSVHNVLRDPPFSRMDVVCCRNLLIYLDRDAQRQVLETFHYALTPGGTLMLGASETADVASDLFVVIDKKNRLYRPIGTGRGRHRMLSSVALQLQSLSQATDLAAPARDKLLVEIHQQLFDEYQPPSILVDGNLKVLHCSPGAGRFLMHRVVPSQRIVELVVPPLRNALQTALQHSLQTGLGAEAARVHMEWKDRPVDLHMVVRPMQHPKAGLHWMLIVFIEAEAAPAPAEPAHVAVIEEATELRQAREDLLRSIGDSETSAEELRAANEELQSLNEELRSATEELETSKEELQSVNEELTTVNYELKSRVEETAKSNDDLKNLIAANDIATVFVTADLRIKRFTPRAAAVFNIIDSDVGRSLLDITHRLDYAKLAEDAREAFRSLRTLEREVRSDDGRWYLVRMVPYRTQEDRIEGAVLNFIDISERRHAEERLRASEARIRLVAETTEDFAIITLDDKGLITGWNKGAEQMFGHAEAEATGRNISLIFTLPDRQQDVPQEEMRRASQEGRAQDERWHLRKDGALVYCSGVTTALPGDGAKGFAKIARDLTATKRIQEQREALLESEKSLRLQLQTANQQKDEFLAVMSHELKNPLNLIALNADLLLRLPETREIAAVMRIAETIRSSVASQAQIIDDLLDLSRMQTGKLALRRQRTEWRECVQRIVDAVQPDAVVKGLQLQLIKGDTDCWVDADPVRLEQIVWNLVSNALKFTPSGGRVDVTIGRDRSEARLEVADTGQGIDPEFMNRLFTMFSQADSSAARRESGLGIGLALTKRLVDMHNGRLEVESQGLGSGARFQVTLPLLAGEADDTGNPSEPRRSAIAGLQLLLVDDQPDMLETFEMLLQFEGAKTMVAANGAEAIELAGKHDFDLLITDLAMPGMDGFALLELLRSSGWNVPAIAVSGMGMGANRKRVLDAGFKEMVSKPVDLPTLLAAVARARGR